jgi:hypothetical protein
LREGRENKYEAEAKPRHRTQACSQECGGGLRTALASERGVWLTLEIPGYLNAKS